MNLQHGERVLIDAVRRHVESAHPPSPPPLFGSRPAAAAAETAAASDGADIGENGAATAVPRRRLRSRGRSRNRADASTAWFEPIAYIGVGGVGGGGGATTTTHVHNTTTAVVHSGGGADVTPCCTRHRQQQRDACDDRDADDRERNNTVGFWPLVAAAVAGSTILVGGALYGLYDYLCEDANDADGSFSTARRRADAYAAASRDATLPVSFYEGLVVPFADYARARTRHKRLMRVAGLVGVVSAATLAVECLAWQRPSVGAAAAVALVGALGVGAAKQMHYAMRTKPQQRQRLRLAYATAMRLQPQPQQQPSPSSSAPSPSSSDGNANFAPYAVAARTSLYERR